MQATHSHQYITSSSSSSVPPSADSCPSSNSGLAPSTCSNSTGSCPTTNQQLQLTPPEHTYSASSCSSSSASSYSPSLHSDLLFPPPSLAHSAAVTVCAPAPALPNSHAATSYASVSNSYPQRQHHHHLPKSLSRSSISSDGSTRIFSPTQDPAHLLQYSPLTPPLPPLAATTEGQASKVNIQAHLSSSFHPTTSTSDPQATAKPSNKLPLLPKLAPSKTTIKPAVSAKDIMAAAIPAVMQPGCISQLATYLAEMVVYLWFSPPQKRAPTFPKPTAAFTRFCNDILTTTQVSQSVVVLGLYFVSKLQNKHSIEPRQGSEYKLTIACLMLANKILDDHTYTNKTWSEVSGLPLDVLNGAEVEFLQGLEFDLHVSHTAYKAWYTMLQNGESSSIVKQAVPSRKRAKVVNPVAPSAPTSPLHHSSNSSSSSSANAGLGFDFTFTMPPPASAVTSSSNQSVTLQVPPSRHSLNAWPAAIPPLSQQAPYLHHNISHDGISSTNPTSEGQVAGRKRRLSDPPAGSPTCSAAPEPMAPAMQSLPPLYIATCSLPRQQPPAPNALPPHLYTPIVSTPTSAMSIVPSSRVTTPLSAQNTMQQQQQQQQQQSYSVQDFMPEDFNALTSSWNPVDEFGNGRAAPLPQDLTYYALAAGQQRGGYLTHQPVPSYLGVGTEFPMFHPPQMQMQLSMQPTFAGRPVAPLPKSTSSSITANVGPATAATMRNSSTPVMQRAGVPQRMSLSLSPVDTRNIYSHDPRLYPQTQFYSSVPHQQQQQQQQSQPHAHSMYHMPKNAQTRMTPNLQQQQQQQLYTGQRPASVFMPAQMQAMQSAQGTASSPLEPSLQNLVLSNATASNATASSACSPASTPLAQRHDHPTSYQSYYTSFANNGLPGVLSWPVQALAKYHNVVQPHQQAWPREFS